MQKLNRRSLISVFAFLFFSNSNVEAKSLPSYVQTCKITTEDMSTCFKNAVLHLRPYLAKGIPEMGLPPVEPLVIPEIELNMGAGSGSVTLAATLYNATFHGGSNFDLRQIRAEIRENGEWYMEIYFPHVSMESGYKAKGKLLLVQFDGDGQAQCEFGGVFLKGNFTGTRVTKKGVDQFELGSELIYVDVETVKWRLGDLFKGNKELNDHINKVIEENIESLTDEIKPVVAETIKSIFLQFLNQVYDKFPLDVLYPKD